MHFSRLAHSAPMPELSELPGPSGRGLFPRCSPFDPKNRKRKHLEQNATRQQDTNPLSKTKTETTRTRAVTLVPSCARRTTNKAKKNPRNKLPVSPMKVRARGKFRNTKPRQPPPKSRLNSVTLFPPCWRDSRKRAIP